MLDEWTAFQKLVPTLPTVQLLLSDITGGSLSDYMQPHLEQHDFFFFHISSGAPQDLYKYTHKNAENWWSYPLIGSHEPCFTLQQTG